MSTFRSAFSHIRQLPQAFWVVIIATLINQLGNMAFVFLIIYLTQSLHYSITKASAVFTCFSLSLILSGLLGGKMADKLGAGWMMTSVLIINSFILFLFPKAHSFLETSTLAIIWGAVFGLYRPATQTLVSHLSSEGMHKVTFSIYRLVLNLGMSIGPAIGGYLAGYSYPSIFIANAIANLGASLFLFFGLFRSPWFSYRAKAEDAHAVSGKSALQDQALMIFALAMIPVSMVFFQHESTLPVFLHNDLHLSLHFYGLLFTINTLIIVFCELPLNIATINWPYRVNFILGSFLIAFGFAGFYFSKTAGHIIFLTVIWTIGEMILYPAANSYISEIAPAEKRGSYFSIYTTASNLGLLLGPLAGSYIMQKTGVLSLWIMCGLWGMVSVILFGYIKEKNVDTVLLESYKQT